MKNILHLFFAITVAGLFTIGQNAVAQQHAPFHKKCGTVEYQNYLNEKYPGYTQRVNETFDKAAQKAEENKNAKGGTEVYRIPVVVHIVHNIPIENLTNDVVESQVAILNRDFRRQNPDTVNTPAVFKPIAADAHIEFYLADVDPDGNPTTGITHTQTAIESFLNPLEVLTGDISSMERIKRTADGGIDPWPQDRYMNIWVGSLAINFLGQELPFILGFATPPDGAPNWPPGSTAGIDDGIVIHTGTFGESNPALEPSLQGLVDAGRTTVHEVGHYLGLRHISGDPATNPLTGEPTEDPCAVDDGIADTPLMPQSTQEPGCNAANTCVDTPVDVPDMIQNYMDYSNETCQNMFTQGQVGIMRAMLEGPRFDLIQELVSPPISAGFSVSNLNPDIGEEVIFTNESVSATTWFWTFGDGTSSSEEDPTHTFTEPGVYQVTLNVSNDNGESDFVTIEITVTDPFIGINPTRLGKCHWHCTQPNHRHNSIGP